MKEYEKNVIPLIESNSNNFTAVEKTIADFFINNKEKRDFAAKKIANQLFVSEAALSRFSQKIGFRGYREFIFQYQKTFLSHEDEIEDYIKEELNTYEELLDKCYTLIDGQQIKRITKFFSEKKRIYVYGMGSSGLAALEFQMRFLRLGLDVEAVTDAHMLTMNSVRLDENCLVLGITISGATKEVLLAMENAKNESAKTVLITSKKNTAFQKRFDEILLVPVKKNLEYGNIISPQFPILILTDILYASYINEDKKKREETYDSTLHAILDREINEEVF